MLVPRIYSWYWTVLWHIHSASRWHCVVSEHILVGGSTPHTPWFSFLRPVAALPPRFVVSVWWSTFGSYLGGSTGLRPVFPLVFATIIFVLCSPHHSISHKYSCFALILCVIFRSSSPILLQICSIFGDFVPQSPHITQIYSKMDPSGWILTRIWGPLSQIAFNF